ncbi:MAG: hypothetical protein MUC47_10100, partial [Candidatus Kapabacteria bacterium]|nr:hypothetical protein [Candidatus Kapabacteria bacterium]
MTAFVMTSDVGSLNTMAEVNKWQFRVLADPGEMYFGRYAVKKAPFGILANREGKILALGPIGSTSYDWGKVSISVEDIVSKRQHLRNVTWQKKVKLDSSEALTAVGLQR